MLSGTLKKQFVSAIRRLLRPIVRQLIAYGVPYPALSQMVKQLYVEVAEREFPLAFKRQTDSRLALVTGLPRKEIAQLRQTAEASREPPEVEDTVVTHVIGRWLAGPPYATAGSAHPLPYDSEEPGAATFCKLLRDIRADLPLRSVLDEMLRLGTVELRADGRVVLRREAHIPLTGVEGKLTLLGSDPAELFATIAHNIEHEDAPRLQRKVVYDNIGSQSLDTLRDKAREVGEDFLRQANALLASCDLDRNPQAPAGKRSRVVMGVYYFEEEVAPPEQRQKREGRAVPPGRIRRSK